MTENEIIVYQPDSTLTLNVKVEDETVWLTQAQMTELFQTSKQNVSLHINNIFKEGELVKESVVKESLTTAADGKAYRTKYYNLDVIISVGYRVKSIRGTQFRQWATKTLKEFLLRGYSITERLSYIEDRIDRKLSEHHSRLDKLDDKVEILLKTNIPPREGILYDGQIFDAYVFVCQLIRHATKRIILVDNYVDETVLTLLNKRKHDVPATIYTQKIDRRLQLDLDRHNAQYQPISVRKSTNVHDRFLIIDEELYHIGASIKDLGKKLFAFSKMRLEPTILLHGLDK